MSGAGHRFLLCSGLVRRPFDGLKLLSRGLVPALLLAGKAAFWERLPEHRSPDYRDYHRHRGCTDDFSWPAAESVPRLTYVNSRVYPTC